MPILAALLLLLADEAPPGPATAGKTGQWKSADGLAYEYFVPKSYDPARGANLTFILHGSNLDRRWGFANHEAGKFRPDDIVVSPDGTTPNGQGGFNSLQGDKDLKRLHALHEELKKSLKINATYLYGHSQGSFFAFYYAGAYPKDVNGVVGQASGVWIGTEADKQHHHQAIALMHGTADPVVPYGQSVGGADFYRKAGYPMVLLRSLEGWNHWPTQEQTEQCLAWCEGMTTASPARAEACLAVFEKAKKGRNDAAAFAVARRAAGLKGISADAKQRATALADSIAKLAERHVQSIKGELGKSAGAKIEDAPWVAHLPLFLRDFEGVPAREKLAAEWAKRLEEQKKSGDSALGDYWRAVEKDPAKAFARGVEAVRVGFLDPSCTSAELLSALEKLRTRAGELKLSKADLDAYDQTVPVFARAREKGLTVYAKINGDG